MISARYASLIAAVRRAGLPVGTQLVELFERIVSDLPRPDLQVFQIGSGAAVKVVRLEMESDGRLRVDLSGAGGTLYLGGTNAIEHSSGAKLTPGGSWQNASVRFVKAGITGVSTLSLTQKVMQLPLFRWYYRAERQRPEKHLGPMAEEFHRIFGLGDGTSIAASDMAAIALACNQEQQKQIVSLQLRVANLERRIERLSGVQ